jgi:hypothetical protein
MDAMPVWLTPSRAATAAGATVILVATLVVLVTGASVAYLGPVLVGGAALGTVVALLMPPAGRDSGR